MPMSARAALAAIGAMIALQLPNSAHADRYPFRLTWGGGANLYIKCDGPWHRSSGCLPIGPGSYGHHEFYYAEDGFFSAVGGWGCAILRNFACIGSRVDTVQFCGPGANGGPKEVEVKFENNKLTVNQPTKCTAARATSVLGQNGEADRTPARDTDTYRFAGKPGEKVEVTLDRDGSGGSAGAVATLRVRAASGATLGQRTGAVPLTLKVTAPGAVEIDVREWRPGTCDELLSGCDPPECHESLRRGCDWLAGYYDLEVIPQSGDIGERKLRPSSDVEQ